MQGMGLRLLVIISIFACILMLYILIKSSNYSATAAANRYWWSLWRLACFPSWFRTYSHNRSAALPGVKFGSGNWYERIKKTLPVFKILLVSSMDRSLQLAESMHARGYGSGRPSSYQIELWRSRDFIIIPVLGLGLLSGLWSLMHGWSSYNYYPRLADFQSEEIIMAAVIMLTLSFPAILKWGWLKCRSLRSKI